MICAWGAVYAACINSHGHSCYTSCLTYPLSSPLVFPLLQIDGAKRGAIYLCVVVSAVNAHSGSLALRVTIVSHNLCLFGVRVLFCSLTVLRTGRRKILYAMTVIPGVGRRMANLVCKSE